MRFISSWLRLCCILEFIEGFDSYVLLAANVHDFRNIAKKLVPEPLAERLSRLALKYPVKQTTQEQPEYNYESETENDYDNTKRDDINIGSDTEATVKSNSKDVYVKEWGSAVNFDELVERVKDRLAKEINWEVQKRPKPEKNTQIENKNINDKERISEDTDDRSKIDENGETKFGSKAYFSPNKAYIENDYEEEKNSEINSNKRHPIYAYDEFQTKTEDVEKKSKEQFKIDYELLEKAQMSNKERESNREPYKSKNPQKDNIDSENLGHKYKIGHGGKEPKNENYDYNDERYTNQEKLYEMNNDENGTPYKKQKSIKRPYKIEELSKKTSKNSGKYENHFPNKHNSENYEMNNKYEDKFKETDNFPLKEVDDGQSISKLGSKNKQSVDNVGLYDQFDLISKRNNDSYEDYVIPNKEKNIFESDETNKQDYKVTNQRPKKTVSTVNHKKNSRFKIKNNAYLGNVKPFVDKWEIERGDVKITPEYDSKINENQDIKAKTESLWFNDDTIKDYDSVSEIPKAKVTIKSVGTMIPTRQFYKIVSPNYYISLPTVAEKYDSNEPLPERDRERQVIKHFGNPPASINKKVRLT